MNVPADEGQMLTVSLKLMNAKQTIEIGIFTGSSLLTAALALPADGEIIAMDPDKEAYETDLSPSRKPESTLKINFIRSDAFSVLNDLLENANTISLSKVTITTTLKLVSTSQSY
ncbi:uncharacterized protein J3R85_009667 [Psidium guajava]|nr:uncharacterized protein J3R85_009667 [Psidium guajava]